MKGRPITKVEFQKMLNCTEAEVGAEAAESWKFILWGLWESALRIDELMHVFWDEPGTIRPKWIEGKVPVLEIPAPMQKNDTEEDIPLLPAFEKLLMQIPNKDRTGWVFDPLSLQLKLGRKVRHQRPDAEWVGKVISRIVQRAKAEVAPANPITGVEIKFASAHDLRRSCGDRLRNAGVPPLVICRVMRHSSRETTRRRYAPGDVQKDAEQLLKHLS
jgi:integrase